MSLRLAFGVFTLSGGVSALFKVDSDATGVESEAAFETTDEELDEGKKACIWTKSTNSSTTLACLDGSMCDAEIDGWSCCGLSQSFRAKCPKGFKACNGRTPEGHDFTCQQDCEDHGGAMSCDGIHPCAWSSSDKRACQELVFAYGQYKVMKIGADGCTPGWKPIQDELTCKDAQFAAGLSFGYVEESKYSVCNFCAGCAPQVVHLHTNHLDQAKWICRRDPEAEEAMKMKLSKGSMSRGCLNDNPPNGLGPRDQYGHGCGDYNNAKDWCGNFDDPDFQALDMCCACTGLEADRRRRGSGDNGDGAGPLDYGNDPPPDVPKSRRRGNVRTGTLVLDAEEKTDFADFDVE